MKFLGQERIGEVSFNKQGSKMIVEVYNNCDDVLVNFIDYNYKVSTTWRHFKNGNVSNIYDITVHNVGYIGEGKYKPCIQNVDTVFYTTWSRMLKRCYSESYHQKRNRYKDCIVCEEWHCFQNFAKWFDENYYEVDDLRMELDKDILVKGNKVYSPETCVFVPQRINSLFTKSNLSRGNLPIGVHLHTINKKYIARCNGISLGSFNTPKEAFHSYKTFKENYIKEVANDYGVKIPKKLYEAMINYKVEIDD